MSGGTARAYRGGGRGCVSSGGLGEEQVDAFDHGRCAEPIHFGMRLPRTPCGTLTWTAEETARERDGVGWVGWDAEALWNITSKGDFLWIRRSVSCRRR